MYEPIDVKSVSDFISLLPNDGELFHEAADLRYLYRGQANKEWSLLPSVYRDSSVNRNERAYVREVVRRFPEEFPFTNDIDYLIKLQHYSMPTRLLDWTGNPLVALYFACDFDIDSDGVVYLQRTTIFKDQDPTIKTISDFIVNCTYEDDESLLKLANKYFDTSTVKHLREPHYFFFAPSLKNERIKRQDGYFAMYSLFDYSERSQIQLPEECMRFIIPYECKKPIRDELLRIGIHVGLLFPELPNQIQYIKQIVDVNSDMLACDGKGRD